MKLAWYLPTLPSVKWKIATQLGVEYAVAALPSERYYMKPWDFKALLYAKESLNDAGLKLEVIEPAPPHYKIKLGLPGRDEEIEIFKQVLRNMAALDIPVLCYNFMPQSGWYRTSFAKKGRGGALVTAFDSKLMQAAPQLTEAGTQTDIQIWDNYKYFMDKVLPVAEACKVKLALHPDDPPVPSLQGVSRIFRNVENFDKALELYPSDYNGITFCQGSFAAMNEDIPSLIRHFGRKIFFVHFRDIRGDADAFEETFHDEGQTDMKACMRAYKEIGFDGVIRTDHAPVMAGESGENPAYEMLGHIFATGYLKGLLEE
nr:mannonate dehydratase [Bacteroides intestinalis]